MGTQSCVFAVWEQNSGNTRCRSGPGRLSLTCTQLFGTGALTHTDQEPSVSPPGQPGPRCPAGARVGWGRRQRAVSLLSVAVSTRLSPPHPWLSRDHPQLPRSPCSRIKSSMTHRTRGTWLSLWKACLVEQQSFVQGRVLQP